VSTNMWSSLGSSRIYLGEWYTHLLSLLFYITSHLLYVPSKLTETMEWTHLPRYERHSGFGKKLNICVGCEGYIPPGNVSHFCLFRKVGYELDGTLFTPCESQYHPECIKVGKPFKTRLVRTTLGLHYPPSMTHFPFICEACTVRAVLGRELTWTSGDIQLLMLERMRLIDMAHAWASSTLQGTARYLGRLSNFGQKYGIDLFPKAPITQPPRSAVIPLLWAVLEYTLQTSRKTGEGIKYNTARSLQSAASAYHLWEKMLQFPGHMYRDRDNNVIGASHLSPTDSVITTLSNKGMRRRLGTDSRPPVALRYSHVAFNQEFRGRQYYRCGNDWLSKSIKNSGGGNMMDEEMIG
jgi:hypothetical protein